MSGEETSRTSPGSLYLLADDGKHLKLAKTLDLDLYVIVDQRNGLSKIHQPALECTKAGAIENRPSLSSKIRVCLLILILHTPKSYKSPINSIILKLSYKDRDASPLFYLCLYRILKCFVIKLYVF
jgi:hypothetical protein